MKGSFEVKSVSRLCKAGGMEHHILIANLPINKLKLVDGKYRYSMNGQDTKHEVGITLTFEKKVIEKRKNQKFDIVSIEFSANLVTINLRRILSLKRIYKLNDRYTTSYSNSNGLHPISYEVSLAYKKEFFESKISSGVKRSPQKNNSQSGQSIRRQKDDTTKVNKPETHQVGPFNLPNRVKIGNSSSPYAGVSKLSPNELRHRDICQADATPYNYSPNADSIRPKNEVLGGTGSNMHR
ncbi:hypothetical protein [Cytobacillus oceanisediminis]|uniref:hypothetical protein n=1 Tax=Cytobacillus oceanisediminis TaxID=665099 RepID=UPI0011A0A37D|nr:hypothetical protein [Cytobacillus oceanisediminis]